LVAVYRGLISVGKLVDVWDRSFKHSTYDTVNTRDDRITVALNLNGAEANSNYKRLLEEKDKIETEVGEELQWLEFPDKKESRIQAEHGTNPLEQLHRSSFDLVIGCHHVEGLNRS